MEKARKSPASKKSPVAKVSKANSPSSAKKAFPDKQQSKALHSNADAVPSPVIPPGTGDFVEVKNKKRKKKDETEGNSTVPKRPKQMTKKANVIKIKLAVSKKETTNKMPKKKGTKATASQNNDGDLQTKQVNGVQNDVLSPKSAKPLKARRHSRIMPLPVNYSPSRVKTENSPSMDGDSVAIGKRYFGWLISHITVSEFMANHWEKQPLLLQRKKPDYYQHLLSREMISQMLLNHNVEYTKNLDITSYVNGQRETHNPEGRALPPDVWAYYDEGCSIRMLNPQTFLPSIYSMNVKLQEYFHCMTGANFYLTPPNSQGFAPHYDDIEAFVLQIEGRKRWKLHAPRQPSEVLARVSSPNLSQEELSSPILDVILEPGDLLYFPRGVIHQASTVAGSHSLHVTLSVYQRNSWADLFEQLLPGALASAAEQIQQLREGIPLDLHEHFGIVYSDTESVTRKKLVGQIRNLFDQIFSEDAIDGAVDQLAKRYQHDALPPLIENAERASTVYGARYCFHPNGPVEMYKSITELSQVRLLRKNILRLLREDGDKLRIYYHTDNSREYHEYEANFLEVDHDAALAVELLVKMYPQYVAVGLLPVEDKIEFSKSLWEKGLILLRE